MIDSQIISINNNFVCIWFIEEESIGKSNYVDGYIHFNEHEILSKEQYVWEIDQWANRVCDILKV